MKHQTPECIADDVDDDFHTLYDGGARAGAAVLAALVEHGYVIVHPDDVEVKKFPDFDVLGQDRERRVAFVRGWNMCLRAIFPERPTP